MQTKTNPTRQRTTRQPNILLYSYYKPTLQLQQTTTLPMTPYIVLYMGPDSTTGRSRGAGEMSPFYCIINAPVRTHLPNGATFDAATVKVAYFSHLSAHLFT